MQIGIINKNVNGIKMLHSNLGEEWIFKYAAVVKWTQHVPLNACQAEF